MDLSDPNVKVCPDCHIGIVHRPWVSPEMITYTNEYKCNQSECSFKLSIPKQQPTYSDRITRQEEDRLRKMEEGDCDVRFDMFDY